MAGRQAGLARVFYNAPSMADCVLVDGSVCLASDGEEERGEAPSLPRKKRFDHAGDAVTIQSALEQGKVAEGSRRKILSSTATSWLCTFATIRTTWLEFPHLRAAHAVVIPSLSSSLHSYS